MMSLPRLLAGIGLLLLSAFVWPTGVSPKMLADASGEVFARALLALGLWIGGAVLAISVVSRLRALDRRQRQGASVLGGLLVKVAATEQIRKRKGPGSCEPSPLISLVGRAGFEPATNGLKVRCSTS